MKSTKIMTVFGVLFVLLLAAACTPIMAPADGIGGTVPMAPEAANPVLDNSSWQLTQLAGTDGKLAPVADGVKVTLAFADGTASGSGGCNRYNGGYTVEGQSGITFGPAASTMMACEAPAGEVEQAYFAMLANVKGFEAAMSTLNLWDADQNIIATFSEVVPVALVGTNWNATMVNNGKEAVTGLVDGTTITAVFGEDGSLTGQACNNYAMGFTVDGNNITIQQGISTMMACENPDEMAQESAYLQMLPQAATYAIDGDMMELRTADGALIASYVAE